MRDAPQLAELERFARALPGYLARGLKRWLARLLVFLGLLVSGALALGAAVQHVARRAAKGRGAAASWLAVGKALLSLGAKLGLSYVGWLGCLWCYREMARGLAWLWGLR